MNERRKTERVPVSRYSIHNAENPEREFFVYDRETEQVIGCLADFSSGGMMVLCQDPLVSDTIMKLRIGLPEEIQGSDELILDAKPVWCRRDEKHGCHNVGFEFSAIFPHHDRILSLLIKSSRRISSENPA